MLADQMEIRIGLIVLGAGAETPSMRLGNFRTHAN
jgi:hypothetical protein